ncbi:hypothetical protein K250101E9_38590 [Enterocloster aldenensis]
MPGGLGKRKGWTVKKCLPGDSQAPGSRSREGLGKQNRGTGVYPLCWRMSRPGWGRQIKDMAG